MSCVTAAFREPTSSVISSSGVQMVVEAAVQNRIISSSRRMTCNRRFGTVLCPQTWDLMSRLSDCLWHPPACARLPIGYKLNTERNANKKASDYEECCILPTAPPTNHNVDIPTRLRIVHTYYT